MWEDIIIKELRTIRKQIECECGNDIDKLFAMTVERQKRYLDKLVYQPCANLIINKEHQIVTNSIDSQL